MTSLQKRKKKSYDENFVDRLNVSKTLFLKARQYSPAAYFAYKFVLSSNTTISATIHIPTSHTQHANHLQGFIFAIYMYHHTNNITKIQINTYDTSFNTINITSPSTSPLLIHQLSRFQNTLIKSCIWVIDLI